MDFSLFFHAKAIPHWNISSSPANWGCSVLNDLIVQWGLGGHSVVMEQFSETLKKQQ